MLDLPTVLCTAQETSHLKEIVYIFAGGGQRLAEFKRESSERNLNCIFLGSRPKSDIPLICSQMDVCICPYKDGEYIASILGNKIFDYMGNGTATIYSGPEGDVSRMLNEANGGICVGTGDSDGIAQAIISLYNDPDRLKKLGYNAKAFIERNFSAAKMMIRFEEIIAKVL